MVFLKPKFFVLALVCFCISAHTYAQFRLPKIISSNMVLQRNKPVPVWGWTSPGIQVTVKFAGQEKAAMADATGYWKVVLAAMPASAKPADMTINAGSAAVTLNNILIGEVWLCSGQSNMEYPMKNGFGGKPLKTADSLATGMKDNNPQIRLFKVEKVRSLPDVTGSGWAEANGTALANFSAAGYYFAKDIYPQLGVPIGMIQSAWGGSRIEEWTPPEAYTVLPAFKAETAVTPIKLSGMEPGKDYKSMILPLAPYALRGFLWYQGESNVMVEDKMHYADKMQALIDRWRLIWEDEKLPFYSVGLAPYYYSKRKDALQHTAAELPLLWEAQWESLRIPYTDMIVTTDLVDNFSDIHPPYKWEVGRRLSLLALKNEYGKKKLISSGPVYQSMKVKKDKAILDFKNNEDLKSLDGKALSWFEIAGDDGKFVPANAVVSGRQVVVSGPGVAKPAAVRFAWAETAQPNLSNKSGLPAVPFRTNGPHWMYKK